MRPAPLSDLPAGAAAADTAADVPPEATPRPALQAGAAEDTTRKRKPKADHGRNFVPVLDHRNRPIRFLQKREGRFYAQMWAERGDGSGRKTARRFPLLTPEGRHVETVAEAKAALDELRHARKTDKLPTAGTKPTLATFAKEYLESGMFLRKKEGTRQNEAQALERWIRYCGSVRVDRLTPAHLSNYLDARLKGTLARGKRALPPAHERTAQLDLVALRNALHAAQAAGHLRELPSFPKLKPPPPPRKGTFTPEQVGRLIEHARTACKANGEQLADFLLLLCYSGAREQEAIQLKWVDVDTVHGVLRIGAGGVSKNRLERAVELNADLAAHLAAMQARRAPDSAFLFPSPRRAQDDDDRPAKSLRESLRMARTAAGLPGFGFHDCRRFFATLAIQAGVDVQTVSRWLGHQDGGILVAKTYADVLADHRRKMAGVVSFALRPAAGPPPAPPPPPR